ncbi:MAG TPA: GH116 family glycosyl hydrolase, partial [Armatimonadota bacterium]|nr:GH116 family glycosyl hydrolase [Armatimonadota bacterium]
ASNYGTLALATPWRETTYETHWLRASWYTPLTDWGKHLLATGRLHDVTEPAAEGNDVGSLGLRVRLSPGESVKLPVFLCWSFPNYEKTWQQCNCQGVCSKPQWKNYYAHQFPDAWTTACYTNKNFDRLERETRLFQQTLFSSTLPAVVLDAVSSQMSIIKSTTCLRLPDGTFYGFEGCHGDEGCCEGSCTHVWQYAQTHAFLYPELERSMREAEYRYSMFPDGKVCFRLQLPLGAPPTDFHACADGQMGAIMQVYRDWQLGAGDSWLWSVWPAVKRSMEYAWIVWDIDQDGLMEGIQHNTYDIEFHGPNPLCGVLYLGALRAAGRMAAYLGEDDFAKLCGDVEARGAVALDAALYNGEYYIQQYDPASGLEHQFGTGCLVDQLLGQQLAHVFGLGYLLPQDHTRQTVASIYRYNFHTDFWNHMNYERIFALNDEAGTVICTWPHGGRPEVPFTYCDEVMIGFEYQLASHLIYEGLVEEGLRVTQAVRDRHDGERRNPWNEFECGNHYARSMANWAVKLALDGFTYSAQQGLIGFAPKVNAAAFQTFWSTGTGWGEYRQCLAERHFRLSVLHGEQHIQQLELADLPDGDVLINVGENMLPAERKDKRIILTKPVILHSGDALDVLVTPRG